jgi:hypothetical protein
MCASLWGRAYPSERLTNIPSNTIFAETKAKDYTRDQWEAALDKAEQRAEPDEWPLIIVDDFY